MQRPTRLIATFTVTIGLVATTTAVQADVPADPGTEQVSVATGGEPGNGTSRGVDVSGDGNIVTFGSSATNLVAGGTSIFDIYVRDRDAGVTEVVSVNDAGQSGSSTSLWPSISRDGSRVAFVSIANNLVGGDGNATADVFVRDRAAGRTILASGAAAGGTGNGRSERAEISADGQHVVFESDATNLVAGVDTEVRQVYIHHLETGVTELVSQSTLGSPADRGARTASISADGRYVAFQSFSTNLVGTPEGYIYIRDTVDGVTSTVPQSGIQQASDPAISGDGRYVAFDTGFAQLLVDVETGTRVGFDVLPGRKATARMSDDGRYVAYYSQAGGFSFSPYRLWVWDRVTDTHSQGSLTDAGEPIDTGAASPDAFGPPGISDNGRIVGFWTEDDGVVPGDTDGIEDIFVRDRGDILGPRVADVVATPAEVQAQDPVTVTATASDAGRGDAVIASVQYRLDDGDWQPMEAADGTLDGVTESTTATFEGLGSGAYEVCVRATDGRGNVSAQPGCTTFIVRATTTPAAVTITRVAEFEDATGVLGPSLFARTWIVPGDGVLPRGDEWDYDTRDDDSALTDELRNGVIEPFGTHGERVTTGSGVAIVAIQAGIDPIFGDDELIDLNPLENFATLILNLDLETGEWSNLDDTITTPISCVRSPANVDSDMLRGEVCFDLSNLSTTGDLDNDGLLDSWERVGLSMDTDPDIELDLPAWGATPDHKDLFVEYDIADDARWDGDVESGLRSVQRAFASAPIDAGGVANPDGQPGIRLWLDTPSPDADLRLPGSSGGQVIATPEACGVDDGFYEVKNANFDRDRRWVFRYALKEQEEDDNCTPGGQAEIGGNDLIVLNGDARRLINGVRWPGGETFMHELGHTLNLRHGGFENSNYKPNYISLMNYRYSFTLQAAGGDGYLDFSPAVRSTSTGPAGPRPALLGDLDEVSLPQGQVLGPDRDHMLSFTSSDCRPMVIAATDVFDLLPNDPGPSAPGTERGLDADPAELPSGCDPIFKEVHEDHDDWAAIVLAFQTSGDRDDGPAQTLSDPDFPDDEEIALRRALATTTDLAVTATGPTEPAVVGSPFVIEVTARNDGAVHAGAVTLTVDGPAGTSAIPVEALAPGASAAFDVPITLAAAGEAVVTLTLANDLTADPDVTDNAVTLTLTAVDDDASDTPDSGVDGQESGAPDGDGGPATGGDPTGEAPGQDGAPDADLPVVGAPALPSAVLAVLLVALGVVLLRQRPRLQDGG